MIYKIADRLQSSDFTYVDNVVETNLLAARAKCTKGEILNVAAGQAVTVNEVIDIINELLGKNVKPIYADVLAGDVKHSLADIALAEKTIGYKPTVPFGQGLERAINWYRDNLS